MQYAWTSNSIISRRILRYRWCSYLYVLVMTSAQRFRISYLASSHLYNILYTDKHNLSTLFTKKGFCKPFDTHTNWQKSYALSNCIHQSPPPCYQWYQKERLTNRLGEPPQSIRRTMIDSSADFSFPLYTFCLSSIVSSTFWTTLS